MKNSTAHQLTLGGRFHASGFTLDALRTRVECLNKAIAEDPNYALAYVELADAYYHASGLCLRPAESLIQVKAAAKKALELDENLAEAHALLAVVAAIYDRTPLEAEKRFGRALELEPNSLLAHQWYGSYLVTQGRMAAAIAEFSRARELDPSSPMLNGLISVTYLFARQPHKALKHAREAQANSESFWFGYWSAALAHEQSGQLVEALDQLEKAWERNTSPWITAVRARVYAKLGRRELAEAILDEANRNAGTQWVAPYFVGTAYFALAEIELAFEWLEKAFHDYDENLNFLAVCPLMDSARTDPRFIDLLGRLGLDQSHAKTHFIVPVVADTPSSG